MLKTRKDDFASTLRLGGWFAGLSGDVQAQVEAGGRLRNVRRGEFFVRQGDAPSALFALIEGQVRAQTTAPTGKTALITVFHPGDFFAFLTCADGRPHMMDYVASVDSVIFVLPYPTAREIFAGDQQLFLYLIEPQLISVRNIIDYLTLTIRMSPIQRLAERLLGLSRSHYYPDGPHRPLLGLSQELLSSAVLCTRQTTNELLGELQSRGMIKSEYGRIDILDPEGLRKIHQSSA